MEDRSWDVAGCEIRVNKESTELLCIINRKNFQYLRTGMREGQLISGQYRGERERKREGEREVERCKGIKQLSLSPSLLVLYFPACIGRG